MNDMNNPYLHHYHTSTPFSPEEDWGDYGDSMAEGIGDDFGLDLLSEEFAGDYDYYEGPATSPTSEILLARLDKLKADSGIDAEILDGLRGRIHACHAWSPQRRDEELASIAMEISSIEAGVAEGDYSNLNSTALEELKKQIQDFRGEIQKMGGLTGKKKEEIEAQLEKWLAEIDLGQQDPESVDVEGIRAELEELKEESEPWKGELPAELRSLMERTSPKLEMEKWMSLLLNHFPEMDTSGDGSLTIQEIQEAKENGVFPPFRPSESLVNLLLEADSKMKTLLEGAGIENNEAFGHNMADASDRLVELLRALYPDHTIGRQKRPADDVTVEWWNWNNNLIFDGELWEAFSETSRGSVGFKWYGPAENHSYAVRYQGEYDLKEAQKRALCDANGNYPKPQPTDIV